MRYMRDCSNDGRLNEKATQKRDSDKGGDEKRKKLLDRLVASSE